MYTIQVTIDQELLERVDQTCQSLGIARSAFIRQALTDSLHELHLKKLEIQHVSGYQKKPVIRGEFDILEGVSHQN